MEALAHVDASFTGLICHLHVLQEAAGNCLQSILGPGLTKNKCCTPTMPYIHCILLSTMVYCHMVYFTTEVGSKRFGLTKKTYLYCLTIEVLTHCDDARFPLKYIHSCNVHILTWNQLMVQQLMRAGKRLKRFLKASPMGLMANTTCSCVRQRSTNMLKRDRGLPSVCFSRSRCRSNTRIRSQISCFSSTANRLGTWKQPK